MVCQLLLTLRTPQGTKPAHGEKTMSKMYMKLNTAFQALKKDERGQDMVEYTILTGMIVVAVVASVGQIGTWVAAQWAALATAVTT
jgi:pilus assembly protein Flp/PilA